MRIFYNDTMHLTHLGLYAHISHFHMKYQVYSFTFPASIPRQDSDQEPLDSLDLLASPLHLQGSLPMQH